MEQLRAAVRSLESGRAAAAAAAAAAASAAAADPPLPGIWDWLAQRVPGAGGSPPGDGNAQGNAGPGGPAAGGNNGGGGA